LCQACTAAAAKASDERVGGVTTVWDSADLSPVLELATAVGKAV